MSLGDLVTQEAERLAAEAEKELWTCIRIIYTSQGNTPSEVGVAFMGIFSTLEAAQAKAVANLHKSIQWTGNVKAGRYQSMPMKIGIDNTIFYVVQKDKRL